MIIRFLITGPLYESLNITKADSNEALGVPLQQIGAVVSVGKGLNESQKEYLNTILPLEAWKESYNPYIVNPVKFNSQFNSDHLRNTRNTFIATWFELLIKNPSTMIEAYLKQASLVWQINTYSDGYTYKYELGVNPIDKGVDLGIYLAHCPSKIKGGLIKMIDITNTKPLEVMWRPALYIVLTLIIFIYNYVRRNHVYNIVLVPTILNTLIVAVAIPAQDFRYLYLNLLILPIAFLFSLIKKPTLRN